MAAKTEMIQVYAFTLDINRLKNYLLTPNTFDSNCGDQCRHFKISFPGMHPILFSSCGETKDTVIIDRYIILNQSAVSEGFIMRNDRYKKNV